MKKKSYLKICEAKPVTKVFSVRIDAALHDRAAEAVKLATALGYQLDLSQIVNDCLLQAVTSAENELIHFLMEEPAMPVQTPITLEPNVPITDEQDDETEAGDFEEYVFETVIEGQN